MLNKILHLGIPSSGLSRYEVKIRKFFNGLTFVGVFVAVLHVFMVFESAPIAALFHGLWAVMCIVGLVIHAAGFFPVARFLVCLSILVLGGMASARIGHELYPHFASIGVLVSTFIFYDLKKEWKYILFILLVGVAMYAIVEADWFKNESVVVEHPYAMRLFTLVGTLAFVSFEIVFLLRLSWLNENYINTELMKANRKLEESLEEKKILLQEVHHRVKNNFQVILSLIKLQTEDLTDEKSKSIFDDLQNRLAAIALMHEMMYKSEQLHKIDFGTYVEQLAKAIVQASSTSSNAVVEVNSNVSSISNESIIPIALILNELFSNSFKHAFDPGLSEKRINVSITKLNKKSIRIEYVDNGKWKEPLEKSFGLDLVDMLVDQLSGNLSRKVTNSGTHYDLVLNL